MCSIPFATDVTIGAQSFINYGCILEGKGAIHIGKRVQLAVGVALLTSTHEIGGPEQRAGRLATAPITIGDGAWIGARSLIFPGVTVGAGAVVAAGSVVRQDVEPNTVVAGSFLSARLLLSARRRWLPRRPCLRLGGGSFGGAHPTRTAGEDGSDPAPTRPGGCLVQRASLLHRRDRAAGVVARVPARCAGWAGRGASQWFAGSAAVVRLLAGVTAGRRGGGDAGGRGRRGAAWLREALYR